MMKQVWGLTLLSTLSTLSTAWLTAAPVWANQWQEVAVNAVGDRFMVDASSIEKRGENVWYWEFREFKQPNNAFLEAEVTRPVHGAVIYRSVDCTNRIERLRRITAYDQKRELIQRFDYGDEGRLNQPREGSSAAKVLQFVCTNEAAQ